MSNKTIMITGGVGGIGTAMAKRIAQDGYRVVLTYLNENEQGTAQEHLQDIMQATGCEGLAIQADVTDYAAGEKAVRQVVDRLGSIDVLVNNAGVFMSEKKFHEMDISQMQKTITINLLGVMYGTRAVLPVMMRQGSGCIVNTASIAGLQSSPGYADYSASKAGVIGFTRSIAGEYAAHGIRCNAIAPGVIDTTMIDHLRGGKSKQELAKEQGVPLERLGTPEDIADCLAYIVHASYLTGQTISPNGGVVMQ